MSTQDKECALCFKEFKEGDKVRGVHPTKGLVFHKFHTYPDGETDAGVRLPGLCRTRYTEPHIHEECIPLWQDKFNQEPVKDKEEAIRELDNIPLFSMYTQEYIKELDKELEDEMLDKMLDDLDEEVEEWVDCPNCPHNLTDHDEITDQVIKCPYCECAF